MLPDLESRISTNVECASFLAHSPQRQPESKIQKFRSEQESAFVSRLVPNIPPKKRRLVRRRMERGRVAFGWSLHEARRRVEPSRTKTRLLLSSLGPRQEQCWESTRQARVCRSVSVGLVLLFRVFILKQGELDSIKLHFTFIILVEGTSRSTRANHDIPPYDT